MTTMNHFIAGVRRPSPAAILRALILFGVIGTLYAPRLSAKPTSRVLVRIEVQQAEQKPVTATVRFEMTTPDGEHLTQDLAVEAPGELELTTSPGRVFVLSASAPGFWAPSRQLAGDAGEETVVLELLPTGSIAGRLETEAVRSPERLAVRFSSAATEERPSKESLLEGETVCEIEGESFRCEVPGGRFDLRLSAEGFAAKYLWDVHVVPRGEVDLGDVALQQGASVVGILEMPRSETGGSERASVTIEPQVIVDGQSATERTRRGRTSNHAAADARGFFQVAGLAPGVYRLRAQAGKLEAQRETLKVDPGAELDLGTLLLEPPPSIEVTVDPPGGLDGTPWIVEALQRANQGGAVVGSIELDLVAPGRWRGSLRPGPYILTVRDRDGARWSGQEVTVDRRSEIFSVFLDFVPLEGRVLAGEEPLTSDLWFGGRKGLVSFKMSTDEDGHFIGVLPRSGNWRVDLRSRDGEITRTFYEVEVPSPSANEPAWVALELGSGLVEGRVVDESSQDVPGALVLLLSGEGTGFRAEKISDTEGRFSFGGLSAGNYMIRAYRQSEVGIESSEVEAVQLVDDDSESLAHQIRLGRQSVVNGKVMAPQGPISGASVTAYPTQGGRPVAGFAPQSRTDIHGRFSLSAPPDADRLDVTVMAPGYAMTTFSVDRPAFGQELQVLLAEAGGTVRVPLPTPQSGGTRQVRAVTLIDGTVFTVLDGNRVGGSVCVQAR